MSCPTSSDQGLIQSLERGGVHFAENLKRKKGHSNNGCPLPNVFTIKYIEILIQILIHSFIVKPHYLMNIVTALLE